ncbi:hypothetical protein ASC89_00310 [Devosia sp. Root413D1]|uniref:hypothetical protein n=1 Tax=Devosia sp. Root413D1 TaxID=1736531 RepID=UPI0006F4D9D3|nr:hypothetical protein [Devosia sp. Root413D1]KQW85567.1 hypothetical protein ASC89_00310 [Devosia sp. Root413D1]
MTQPQHQRHSGWRNWLCTAAVALTVIASSAVFVFGQYAYVSNGVLFWTTIASIVALSFWSSCMEAAYSTINSDQNPVAEKATAELDALGQTWVQTTAEAGNAAAMTKKTVKVLAQLQARRNVLVGRHRMASGIDRAEIVGAFASLSVLLNLSLGIVLPIALASQIAPTLVIDLTAIYAWLQSYLVLPPGIPMKFDLTSQKSLVFVATTVPILLAGKIIPKTIGLNSAGFWIGKFSGLARIVQVALGWISVGTSWVFQPKS